MAAFWGLMAEFATADQLLAAAKRARAAGYAHAEAYSPFPIEGLAEALGFERNRVPLFTLIGGLVGGAGGFFLEWYSAVVSYPIDVGGRPFDSWPMFIPVTFELAVLVGAFSAFIANLVGNGLPKLRHPVFDAPDFDLASRNRFFLCLRSDEPRFDRNDAEGLLHDLHPMRVVEVPR